MRTRSSKREEARRRRHVRVRSRVSGTTARPRLCVFRSLRHIFAQVVDDSSGRTLVAASSLSKEIRESGEKHSKAKVGKAVGALLAQRAKAKGIETVTFDRGGYLYHGRVKALAEGAREGGLKF
ncbi:MAG: 50S ribosomal protein L18 [Candidatus Eisenbacteria bacterium]|nr:50S ribosomal protein L18 [Candidatus Eisenbacteria bacterium]